jgi:hypothetical protein
VAANKEACIAASVALVAQTNVHYKIFISTSADEGDQRITSSPMHNRSPAIQRLYVQICVGGKLRHTISFSTISVASGETAASQQQSGRHGGAPQIFRQVRSNRMTSPHTAGDAGKRPRQERTTVALDHRQIPGAMP